MGGGGTKPRENISPIKWSVPKNKKRRKGRKSLRWGGRVGLTKSKGSPLGLETRSPSPYELCNLGQVKTSL